MAFDAAIIGSLRVVVPCEAAVDPATPLPHHYGCYKVPFEQRLRAAVAANFDLSLSSAGGSEIKSQPSLFPVILRVACQRKPRSCASVFARRRRA